MAWRGILMDDERKEVWLGQRMGTPGEAFDAMKVRAPEHGITDLRPWSGTVPDKPLWTP